MCIIHHEASHGHIGELNMNGKDNTAFLLEMMSIVGVTTVCQMLREGAMQSALIWNLERSLLFGRHVFMYAFLHKN